MKHFSIRAAIAPLFPDSGRNNRNGLPEKTDFSSEDVRYMRMTIDLPVENIDNGGDPLGAVTIHDGEVIAVEANRVVPSNDLTTHAEANAIRNACQKLDTLRLEGCTIYGLCEPCPMCLSTLYQAGAKHTCYGNTKADAKVIDSNDPFIYDQLDSGYDQCSIRCEHFLHDEAQKAFRE